MQEKHVLMIPFVVMMGVNIFSPFLEFVRSKVHEEINRAKHQIQKIDEDEYERLSIILTAIPVIIAIYSFLVSFAAWKSVKEY